MTIVFRVDKKLECGSVHGIFQIVGEEIEPGERQEHDPPCAFLGDRIAIGLHALTIAKQGVDNGCPAVPCIIW